MTTTLERSRSQLLCAAAELVDPAAVETTAALLERFYRHTVTEDLLNRRPEDLLGAALSLRSLARARPQGTARVRVFTPVVEQDGWSCGHTVIEVVNDDMPFLVDSVTAEIARQSRSVHLIVHPQVGVRRDAAGHLEEVLGADVTELPSVYGVMPESWMHVEIDRVSDAADRLEIADRIQRVLSDVRVSVEDWPRMVQRANEVADEIEAASPQGIDADAVEEAVSLLRWLADGQFTFLGYRRYRLREDDVLEAIDGTGLGLLRYDSRSDRARSPLPPDVAEKARRRNLLVITKANTLSTVHRSVYLDYISVKTFDAYGEVSGEQRFLGLFTASAYAWSVLDVPYINHKVKAILDRSGFNEDSHLGNDLLGVLEAYPRDELFQADVATLTETAKALVHLQERRRTAIFTRPDTYGRYMSCLVYIPRDRYTTTVRRKVEALLTEAFHAERVDFTTRVSDSALARLHFVTRVGAGESLPEVDSEELQRRIYESTRTWDEDLAEAARAELGDEAAAALLARYARGVGEAYKESYQARVAVADLRAVQALPGQGALRLNLYHVPGSPEAERRLKLYRRGALSLSQLLPVFTDMGVEVTDERPYQVRAIDGEVSHIYDFGLRVADENAWTQGPEGIRSAFQEAFEAVWSDRAESDGFNALVLRAGLSWREITILRAVARYLRQIGLPFSNTYLEATLTSHPRVARLLVDLFAARFDPERFADHDTDPPDDPGGSRRRAAQDELAGALEAALDDVASLDMDRIIRAFLGVITATVRTNYYQVDDAGAPKPALGFKLDPSTVPNLPQPRPMFEIWVYSPRVEGVHLRFGKVARGGLRWSDRREDFRTENLGLVKAQMAKNAVIVPSGSKGAFYPKRLPDPAVGRDAWLAEGVTAYQLFISAMLDVTDNRVGGDIVPPPRVVRHDDDDPYLVVAADKGTATFSDIANEVAASYGFWLDDAFASGGSAGYDHKAMGITARGAWESVKRHFRELGHDTQSQDFTVVGIGDMSGDVFGNGMVLSGHTRLIAAFDHRHVFVDPTPDAATSFAERRRLFELPRSSWEDYDPALISVGGGVFPRSAKSITLTPQIREALGIEGSDEAMTPAELIHAVLLAPVDLLWNGGIGTYIKATSEVNADIGDRANDAIRVNAADLRCRVVGEGGNLGASQLGRIEAAQHGVRINSDAVDNSAGVDTSDHEVNIKILLGELVRQGDMTLKQRNALLESMTDDVAAMVLRDNYEQNVLLGNARLQGLDMTRQHQRFMHWLEARGELDRALQFLPDDAAFDARIADGRGLTSPEFAVLMAYAKLSLKAQLQDSALVDDPWFAGTLADYFPPAIREAYRDHLAGHPLRREIIVNAVANSIVNRGGITFMFRAIEETGGTPAQVARAFVVCREVFGLSSYVKQVEATDNVVATDVQAYLYLEFRRLLDRAVRWFLQNRPATLDVGAEIRRFSAAVAGYAGHVPALLRDTERERLQARIVELVGKAVPEELAVRAASLLDSFSVLDVTELAQETGLDVARVAPLYFEVSAFVGIDRLLRQVNELPRQDRWDALARAAIRDDLYDVLESLTRVVIAGTDGELSAADRLASWLRDNPGAAERTRQALAGVEESDRPTLAALSVALRALRSIARSGSATV